MLQSIDILIALVNFDIIHFFYRENLAFQQITFTEAVSRKCQCRLLKIFNLSVPDLFDRVLKYKRLLQL